MKVPVEGLSPLQIEVEIRKALETGHWCYMGSQAQVAAIKIREHFTPPPEVWAWDEPDNSKFDIRIFKFNEIPVDICFKIPKTQSTLRQTTADLLVDQTIQPSWWRKPLSQVVTRLLKIRLR